MGRRDNLVDKCGPVVRPFLLQDGDEDQIQLVYQSALLFEPSFRLGTL